MQTTLVLNLNNSKERQALRAMLDVLDNAPPEGFEMGSGSIPELPSTVTCWTSTEGAELVKEELNTNPTVDEVRVREIEHPVEDVQEESAPKDEKPDARKLVEAVVGVKTGKGAEAEGSVEEVLEVTEGEKIDEDTIISLRKLQVKLAKYSALDEMKSTIREVTGIQKGKLADIPANHGPALIDALTAVVSRLEAEGK